MFVFKRITSVMLKFFQNHLSQIAACFPYTRTGAMAVTILFYLHQALESEKAKEITPKVINFIYDRIPLESWKERCTKEELIDVLRQGHKFMGAVWAVWHKEEIEEAKPKAKPKAESTPDQKPKT